MTSTNSTSSLNLIRRRSTRACCPESRGLLDELGSQPLAGTQLDTTVAQVPGDRVAVGSELASQLVRGQATAVELDQLTHLGWAEPAGHPVLLGVYPADLRRCVTSVVLRETR